MIHFLEARQVHLATRTGGSALSDISCRFSSGELSIVTGQNGSGKTALLRVLRGLAKPEAGQLKLDGQDLPFRDSDVHKRIAFVPQDPFASIVARTLTADLSTTTVGDSDNERKALVGETLEKFGLRQYAQDDPFDLPYGKLKMYNIACAVSGSPSFVLLDDPFCGLDLANTRALLSLISSYKEQGIAFVVATQDLDRVMAHADHVILLKDGRSIADALPERVIPFLEAHGVRKPNAKLQDMTWLGD